MTGWDGYYNGMILNVGGEFRRIVAYNSTTFTVTVDPPFTWGVPPVAGDPWNIRPAAPVSVGQTQVGSTNLEVVLDPLESSTDDIFVGMFLFMPLTMEYKEIEAYNGTTKIATLKNALSFTPPAFTDYEILAVVCHERYTLGGADPTSEEYAEEYEQFCSEESPVFAALEAGEISLTDEESHIFVGPEGEFEMGVVGPPAEGGAVDEP